MGSQYIVRVTASSEDGHHVEVRLDGMTQAISEENIVKAKAGAAELFEWAFGEQPDEIIVKDSMRYVSDGAAEDEDRARGCLSCGQPGIAVEAGVCPSCGYDEREDT